MSSEVQILEAMLARARAAAQNGDGSLTSEETGGVPKPKGDAMARATVYQDRTRWRVRIVDRATGRKSVTSYGTEGDARKAAIALLRTYERPTGKVLEKALADYGGYLQLKGNRPRSISTTLERLTTLFSSGDLLRVVSGDLTPVQARKAWEKYTSTPGKKSKRPPAVNTRVGVLVQAKTFLRWCASKGWAQEGLLGGIEVLGERKRGKPQFVGKDESRKFLAKALELGAEGDAGAIAGATALLLGMRASEITDRTVRELDDDGKVLVITSAKTRAGIRRLEVPEVLRPLLAGLAKGKEPTDKIFGPKAERYWVLRAVNRVCKLASVTIITAHGLRGTHASLAVGAGISGPAVAASLGHETFGVTSRHYATAESVAGAAADRFQAAIT
jgi:integrase